MKEAFPCFELYVIHIIQCRGTNVSACFILMFCPFRGNVSEEISVYVDQWAVIIDNM